MDYLRQLGNDEKRQRSVVVATVEGKDLVGPLDPVGALAVSTIPAGTVVGKVYAVVVTPFAAGATLKWGFLGLPVDFLTDLDLTVVGATRSAKPDGGVFVTEILTYIVPNTAAFDSAVGEVKLCIELSEPAVKSGKYSA